jgi:hypothetical protein
MVTKGKAQNAASPKKSTNPRIVKKEKFKGTLEPALENSS